KRKRSGMPTFRKLLWPIMRLRKKESDREQSKIDSTTPHGEEIGWRKRLALGADAGRCCRRHSGLRAPRQSSAAAACCEGHIVGHEFSESRDSGQARFRHPGESR